MSNKVLVTGASGLLGIAAIEKFLSAGWEVIGVSRRKPELFSGREIEFLSVDLRDLEVANVRQVFEPLIDITAHRLYSAAREAGPGRGLVEQRPDRDKQRHVAQRRGTDHR